MVSLFAKHEGFHALARDAVAAEAAEAARWHQQWYREPLQAAAERRAARVLADNFKLAAHSPSDDEVQVSLNATLSKLTQL